MTVFRYRCFALLLMNIHFMLRASIADARWCAIQQLQLILRCYCVRC